MESVKEKDPKENQIINKDDSITNKDGDNYLEKGELPADQMKPDKERAPTVTPDNENGNHGSPEEEDSSNVGEGPAVENL